jgi:hypothetical protein
VELHELRVEELRAQQIGERLAVAGALPRVGVDLECATDAAGGENDRLRLELHELAVLAPVAERAVDALLVAEEPRDRALHVDGDPEMDAVLLERADHLEAGAIADVREARIRVPTEVALEDAAVLRAIEEGAPLLELVDAVGRFHRVELRHAPLIQVAAALHRVLEVDLPVVLRLDVAERRRHAALGHDGVRLAEERLADEADRHAHRARFDRCAKACASGSDDEDVVGMGLVLRVRHGGARPQKKRMSVIAPEATDRM